ncbi:AMP-binding protein [Sphingobium subterraneum]|uniref:AMP-binding protein n=1 Tax=Sphingobium subterraneum TaxID=627688 RepID=UPI0016122369
MDNIRLPISSGQKAIVLKAIQDPADVSHNLLAVFELKGFANCHQLMPRLVQAIASRPALLMRIEQENGAFFQIGGSIEDIKIQTVEVSSPSVEYIVKDAQDLADRPFEILGEALIRIRVYDREGLPPVLAIIANHTVADLASLHIVFEDIVADSKGGLRNSDLSSLQEFLAHDILARRGQNGERSADFWRVSLQGAPEETGLPLDRPRPVRRARRGISVRRDIAPETAAQVGRLAREIGATEFTIYLAAFFLLLSIHDDSGSIVVGTPVSLRTKSSLRKVVGYLANVVPIRIEFPEFSTAADVIRAVRARTAEAMDHADHPLDAILRAAHVKTQANVAPLFQTLFMWNDIRSPARGRSTSDLQILHLSQRGCAFDLMPTVFMTEEASWFSLQGDAGIFDRTTLDRLADYFFRIVDLVCKDPALPLESLRSCLGPPAFLAGHSASANEGAIGHIFRYLASGSDAIAVQTGSRSISYAQLSRHAGTAQDHLRKLSLGAGDTVALSFDRSVGYIAYLLACLASGIAFVPVSASEPCDRLLGMLQRAGASCLVTDREFRPDISVAQHASVSFAGQPIADVELYDGEGSAAAYVLFTSGSTGLPKGVVISRDALSKTVAKLSDLVGFSQNDSIAAISAFTFDISLLELLMPFFRHGRLHLLDDEASGDPVRIAGYVAKHPVTFLQATPSMWRLLVMARLDSALPLTALCGGEALGPDLAQDILPKVKVLWNLYGPTEATIWATAHQVITHNDEIPIGLPVSGMNIGIFGRDGALLQQGVVGEVGLAGEGLALEYASDPISTAERFRALAGGGEVGRWYLTGDLGMIRDGRLLFRGRRDGQVKINGHRIELGEVAGIAERVDGVTEAAAVAWREGPQTHISLFFSPSEKAASDIVETRILHAIHDSLPRQMHPRDIRAIERIPKTSSGKTDHRELKHLAAQQRIERRADNAYRGPTTSVEAALVDIWESVLRIDPIGVDDDFFDLGGTSIQGVEIAVRAQNLDLQISPETILAYSTIAEISAELIRVSSIDA